MADRDDTVDRLRVLIVRTLNLDDVDPAAIDASQPLLESGYELDSVDVLELVVAIEAEFGIRIEAHEISRDTFRSVQSLAEFVVATQGGT